MFLNIVLLSFNKISKIVMISHGDITLNDGSDPIKVFFLYYSDDSESIKWNLHIGNMYNIKNQDISTLTASIKTFFKEKKVIYEKDTRDIGIFYSNKDIHKTFEELVNNAKSIQDPIKIFRNPHILRVFDNISFQDSINCKCLYVLPLTPIFVRNEIGRKIYIKAQHAYDLWKNTNVEGEKMFIKIMIPIISALETVYTPSGKRDIDATFFKGVIAEFPSLYRYVINQDINQPISDKNFDIITQWGLIYEDILEKTTHNNDIRNKLVNTLKKIIDVDYNVDDLIKIYQILKPEEDINTISQYLLDMLNKVQYVEMDDVHIQKFKSSILGDIGIYHDEKDTLTKTWWEETDLFKQKEGYDTTKRRVFVDKLFDVLKDTNKDCDNCTTSVKLEDFLGQYLGLYKQALEEESKDSRYIQAVAINSTVVLTSNKDFEKKTVIWIGGPSSSGKTNSSKILIEQLLTGEMSKHLIFDTQRTKKFIIDSDTGQLAYVLIDGDKSRKTSQMRQLLLQVALAKGWTGIEDLTKYDESDIKSTILKNVPKNIHIVIPKTFSAFTYQTIIGSGEYKMIDDYAKNSYVQQIFAQVIPTLPREDQLPSKGVKTPKDLVAYYGNQRAFKLQGTINYKDIKINNMDIKTESKAYKDYFDKGVNGTNAAKKVYDKLMKDYGKTRIYVEIYNNFKTLPKMRLYVDDVIKYEDKDTPIQYVYIPETCDAKLVPYNLPFNIKKEKRDAIVELLSVLYGWNISDMDNMCKNMDSTKILKFTEQALDYQKSTTSSQSTPVKISSKCLSALTNNLTNESECNLDPINISILKHNISEINKPSSDRFYRLRIEYDNNKFFVTPPLKGTTLGSELYNQLAKYVINDSKQTGGGGDDLLLAVDNIDIPKDKTIEDIFRTILYNGSKTITLKKRKVVGDPEKVVHRTITQSQMTKCENYLKTKLNKDNVKEELENITKQVLDKGDFNENTFKEICESTIPPVTPPLVTPPVTPQIVSPPLDQKIKDILPQIMTMLNNINKGKQTVQDEWWSTCNALYSEDDVKQLKEKITQHQQQLVEKEQQLVEKEEEITLLKADRNKTLLTYQAEMAKKQNDIAMYDVKLEKDKVSLHKLETEILKKDEEIITLKTTITQKETDKTNLTNELEQLKQAQTQSQDELVQQIQQHQLQLVEKEAEIAQLKQQLQTLEEEKINLETEKEGLEEQITTNENLIAGYHKTINQKITDISQSKADVERLSKIIEEQNATIIRQQETLEECSRKVLVNPPTL